MHLSIVCIVVLLVSAGVVRGDEDQSSTPEQRLASSENQPSTPEQGLASSENQISTPEIGLESSSQLPVVEEPVRKAVAPVANSLYSLRPCPPGEKRVRGICRKIYQAGTVQSNS